MSAFTQAQLDELEKSIAAGVLSVKYQDRTVTYQSLTEMIRIRDLIKKELGQVSTQNQRVLMSHSKGF